MYISCRYYEQKSVQFPQTCGYHIQKLHSHLRDSVIYIFPVNVSKQPEPFCSKFGIQLMQNSEHAPFRDSNEYRMAAENYDSIFSIPYSMIFTNLSLFFPSLRVNLDMGKIVYCFLVMRDEEISGTVVRSTTIPEELGRIQYVLTDKTGTLTQNEMVGTKSILLYE